MSSYWLMQKTEQQGWTHINDLTNGALETDECVLVGSMSRTKDGKPGGLTSTRCRTPEIRDALFAMLDTQIGCGDKPVMCVPASRAAIASKREDWEFKVRTGRPAFLLLHCPQVVIDYDLGRYRNDSKDWCWFCGDSGHRPHTCPTHAAFADNRGRY